MDEDALSNLRSPDGSSQSGGLTAEQAEHADAVSDVETLAASDVQSIVGQAIGAIDTPEGLTANKYRQSLVKPWVIRGYDSGPSRDRNNAPLRKGKD